MTTPKESFSITKFDLNFRLEFVTVADSLQDLGEIGLPSLTMDCNGPSDNQPDLSDYKETLQFWLNEIEETFKEKAAVESSLQGNKEKLAPNEQNSLDIWLVNLYDELKMSQLRQEAEIRLTELRRSIMLEQTTMEDNALTFNSQSQTQVKLCSRRGMNPIMCSLRK